MGLSWDRDMFLVSSNSRLLQSRYAISSCLMSNIRYLLITLGPTAGRPSGCS